MQLYWGGATCYTPHPPPPGGTALAQGIKDKWQGNLHLQSQVLSLECGWRNFQLPSATYSFPQPEKTNCNNNNTLFKIQKYLKRWTLRLPYVQVSLFSKNVLQNLSNKYIYYMASIRFDESCNLIGQFEVRILP